MKALLKSQERVNKMQASKVSLNAEMLEAMASPLLSEKKKKQLRKSRIITYIKSKPPGTPIAIDQLIYEAGYSRVFSTHSVSYKKGWGLVQQMVANKEIIREKIPGKRGQALYFIPGDAQLVRTVPKYEPPKPKALIKLGQPNTLDLPPKLKDKLLQPRPEEINDPYQEFILKAKKFAWDNNSDSLRAFIATL